jgi:membrane protein
VAVLLVGATTVFAELQSALDRIWHVPVADKPKGIGALLRTRMMSFGLILGVAFLLMVSLTVSAGLAALGNWAGSFVQGWETLLQILNMAVSVSIATVLFAMIFKLMPSTQIAWRDVWIGAAVTAVLFEVGKLLIGLYLGKSSMTESFAAAGSLVVLLAWVYYAAQIFLLGAEFTKVYADEHGSLSGAKAMEGTAKTAAAGKPVEVTQPAPGTLAPVPVASPNQQAMEHEMEVTRNAIVTQLISLAMIALLDGAVSKYRRRVDLRLSLGRDRHLTARVRRP